MSAPFQKKQLHPVLRNLRAGWEAMKHPAQGAVFTAKITVCSLFEFCRYSLMLIGLAALLPVGGLMGLICAGDRDGLWEDAE